MTEIEIISMRETTAFFPLLPWILLGGLGGVIYYFLEKLLSSPDKETKRIAILGMKGAGKTTLWNRLRNLSSDQPKATQVDNVDEFRLRKEDGSPLYISATQDIGGQDELVGRYYEKLIVPNTFIYFVFSLSDLQKDKNKEYRKGITARLEKINKLIEDKKIQKSGIGIRFVATHLDQIGNDKHLAYQLIEKKLGLNDHDRIFVGSLLAGESTDQAGYNKRDRSKITKAMRILFYQHEELNQPDYIAVDGLPKKSGQATAQMQILLELADRVISKSEPWAGKLGDYHFVKGFLAERDERGRRMTFMYLAPASIQTEELATLISEDLAISDKHLAQDTAEALESYQRHSPHQTPMTVGAIAVALISIIVLIYIILR